MLSTSSARVCTTIKLRAYRHAHLTHHNSQQNGGAPLPANGTSGAHLLLSDQQRSQLTQRKNIVSTGNNMSKENTMTTNGVTGGESNQPVVIYLPPVILNSPSDRYCITGATDDDEEDDVTSVTSTTLHSPQLVLRPRVVPNSNSIDASNVQSHALDVHSGGVMTMMKEGQPDVTGMSTAELTRQNSLITGHGSVSEMSTSHDSTNSARSSTSFITSDLSSPGSPAQPAVMSSGRLIHTVTNSIIGGPPLIQKFSSRAHQGMADLKIASSNEKSNDDIDGHHGQADQQQIIDESPKNESISSQTTA